MDISKFNTKDKANEGQWVPITLFGEEADFDLLILGDDSDIVQKYERKATKRLTNIIGKAINGTGKPGEAAAEDSDDDDSYDESVIARIAGIRGWNVKREEGKEQSRKEEPVMLCGTQLKNDRESYLLLITKIPAIKEIVMRYARDRNHFLLKPSKN